VGQQDPLRLGGDCMPHPLLLPAPSIPLSTAEESHCFFHQRSEESGFNLDLNHCEKEENRELG